MAQEVIYMHKIDSLRNKNIKSLLDEYLENNCSISALLKSHGLSPNNKHARQYVVGILKSHNIDSTRSIQTKIQIIGKDRLFELVSNAQSVSEILANIGLKDIRSNRSNLITVCNEFELAIPKFNRKRPAKPRKWSSESILKDFTDTNEITPSNTSLKNWFLQVYTGDKICVICNLAQVWNGKPLILQLDHIDGNKRNNTLTNLRLLCPNCHSQTDTFVRKNAVYTSFSKPIGRHVEPKENVPPKRNRKVPKVDMNELIDCVEKLGYLQTGKKYGVSDTAVRKWVKSYGYDPKTLKPMVDSPTNSDTIPTY